MKKYYERLLIIAVVFLVFFVIMVHGIPLLIQSININPDSRQGMLLLSTLQALVLFILPSIVSARIITRSPDSFLRLSAPPSGMAILGIVFAYLIALPALNQLIFWNSNISFPDSMAYWGETMRELEEKANAAATTMLNTPEISSMLVNLLVVGLITAFAEELFFRGTLQSAAASNGSPHTAIWVVALLFSAMHFQVFGFIPRFLLGAWFGYLLFWTRSLYVPIFAHFLNNGVVVVCSWLSANGATTDFDKFGVAETGFPFAAFISAVATAVFIIYFRRFFFEGKSNKIVCQISGR